MLNPQDACRIAEQLVERGIAAGASAADALYAADRSSGVQVRLGEIDSVSRSEGAQIGLRLFDGQRSATVASSDLSDDALSTLVERCLAMARGAPEDPFAGLAPAELLQGPDIPVLESGDGFDPDPQQLRARALAAETAALAVEGVNNSSGAGASASASVIALATSDGFSGAYAANGHGCSVGVIAGEGSSMQRDHAWHSVRYLDQLDDSEELGRRAGKRAVSRLDPQRPRPGKYPIFFDPRVSRS